MYKPCRFLTKDLWDVMGLGLERKISDDLKDTGNMKLLDHTVWGLEVLTNEGQWLKALDLLETMKFFGVEFNYIAWSPQLERTSLTPLDMSSKNILAMITDAENSLDGFDWENLLRFFGSNFED